MNNLTRDIKKALRIQANPDRASQQQAYMKSAMPYHGVPSPVVAALCREVFACHPIETADHWHDCILELWRQADYREERYVAQNLAAVRAYKHFQTMKSLPVYEEMIVDGAWWDLVDGVVARLGELLIANPAAMKTRMLRWSAVPDIWQRRASIICQLKLKTATDQSLLFTTIENNFAEKEFFIRKAIGWALRTYGITAPDTVIDYVQQHKDQLHALSKREALKRLLKSGAVSVVP